MVLLPAGRQRGQTQDPRDRSERPGGVADASKERRRDRDYPPSTPMGDSVTTWPAKTGQASQAVSPVRPACITAGRAASHSRRVRSASGRSPQASSEARAMGADPAGTARNVVPPCPLGTAPDPGPAVRPRFAGRGMARCRDRKGRMVMTIITLAVYRISRETGARTEVQGKTTHLCPGVNPSDKGFGFPPCQCPPCKATRQAAEES